MIEVNNINFYYNKNTPLEKKALDQVSFKIDSGDSLGIVGSSGSGKSTLALHLNGILRPESGNIIIDGENITTKKANLADIRKKIGLALQFPEEQLFEETVYSDVSYGIRKHGFSEEEIASRVKSMLKLVNLNFDKVFFRSPFELSGGEKRKTALAGIFIMDPPIFVLDEPTAGLDPISIKETIKYIEKLNKISKKTMIIISHNIEIIAKLCNKTLALKNGKVEFFGNTRELLKQEKILINTGLCLPTITDLMHKLKQNNFNIRDDIFTTDEAAQEIYRIYS